MLNELPDKMIVNSTLIEFDNILDSILLIEQNFAQQIDFAVKEIIDSKKRIIMISGPSSSGKTTFSKLLAQKLQDFHYKTFSIEMDNYFKSFKNNNYPILSNGAIDYESPNCLDKTLLLKDIELLNNLQKTKIPIFDFKTRTSIPEQIEIVPDEKTILIFEGIHALNPEFLCENTYKIYVTTNSKLNILNPYFPNDKYTLDKRNIRLIRRAIRDVHTRYTSIEKTLSMWNNVVEGELKYIDLYKPQANVIIDTSLPYEPFLLIPIFNDLLKKEKINTPLKNFPNIPSIDKSYIPKSSLINEFL